IEAMGSKIEARERMLAAGVPIIPGVTEPVESADEVRRLGDELGWPIAIKASAGGGGKGLKVVRDPDEAERAFVSARREGEAYFSDPAVYVEHTVTELVTGLDLVREQVLIAAGERLSLQQKDVHLYGHAFECRINAEDVSNGFLPAPGTIERHREPSGPGVRVDSGVAVGSRISPLYDPMIAKLVVHGLDREQARRRMLRALDEFVIDGVKTLIGFHKALLAHPCFVEGETCHGLVESELMAARAAELENGQPVGALEAGAPSVREAVRSIEVEGRRFEVRMLRPEPAFAELARRRRGRSRGGASTAAGRDAVVSPMQGTVLAVEVADGDDVEAGQVLCVVEAMKMENEVHAHRAGRVSELSVAPGEPVKTGQVICIISAD